MNSAATSGKPAVLFLPGPDLHQELFTPGASTALTTLADVTFNETGERWTTERLAAEIGKYDGLVTGWGSPAITDEVLQNATRLKVIAHSAGSVKGIIPESVFDRDIKVSSAAIAIAGAVAEYSLLLVMLGLRPVHLHDYGVRHLGQWDEARFLGTGREIRGSRIGVVGAGGVGRLFIGLLNALNAEAWVYDPYLSDADAAALNVRKTELNELFSDCPIVVVHAPTTPETHHMIGAEQLGLLRDGGYLVCTARSWVIDQDSLLAELQSGRIRAALDVFDVEPLPQDSPFRKLDNAIITPHVAGATIEARYRQGDCVVRDLENAFSGRPLAHEVTRARYAILA